MVSILPGESNWDLLGKLIGGNLGQGLTQGVSQGYTNQLQKYKEDLQRNTNQKIISDLENRRGLPQGSLSAYAADPKMAEQITRPQNPPGGLSGQAVPPEIAQAIPNILNANKEADSDQLAQAFDAAGIPRAYSNSYIENRRQTTKPTFEPESEKLEAKRVSDLATELEKNYTTARNEDIRLDRMLNLSNKGDVSTPLMLKTLDTIGLPIGILSNPDTEEYRKLETDFIRDARDVFPGGRITNYEIESYLKTIPSLMNSKEGREAIIRNRKLLNEAKLARYEEYKKILKENNGRKPPNMGVMIEERVADKIMDIEDRFKSGIEKEVEKFQQPIRMLDPEGNPVNIPPSKIEQALKAGARFG